MKKKIILLSIMATLCGCSIIDDTIKDMKSTKYGLAKNSVNGYAQAIKTAYTDYQYAVSLGTYTQNEDATPVIIDGKEVYLNVKYYDDNAECKTIQITNGKVNLDDCQIYGYTFKYENGDAIEKWFFPW